MMLAATPLAAQLKSVPVYPVTGVHAGWAVAVDFGSGLNRASGRARHVGAGVNGGLGPVRFGLAGGVWDPGTGTSTQVGATAGLRLRGSDATRLSAGVLAGLGYVGSGTGANSTTYYSAPVALTITLNTLRRGRHAIVPWIAPRVELDRVSFAAVRGDQVGVGVSAGVSLALLDRVGVHAAGDWLQLFERREAGVTLAGGSRLTAGIGMHFLLCRRGAGR